MFTMTAFHRRDNVLKSSISPQIIDLSYKELPQTAARFQSSLCLIVPTLDKFRQLVLSEVKRAKERVQEATERAHSMALMYGMASLPDDILAIVFKIAVCAAGSNCADVAVNLSQVSTHFRSVALSNSSLWSCIHGSPTRLSFSYRSFPRTRLCLERSAQVSLDIAFNFRAGNWDFNRFMEVVLPHVSRWKSCTLEFYASTEREDFRNAVTKLGTFYAPNLEKLRFCRVPSSSGSDSDSTRTWIPPLPKWSLPNLQEVELQDFDLDVHRYPSVRKISQTVGARRFDFKSFFTNVMSLHSLHYLHLCLIGEEISQDFPRIDLPSVAELSLRLRVRYTNPYDIALTAINCPNVTDLSIDLFYMLDDEIYWIRHNGRRKEIVRHYIRHFFALPERFGMSPP